MDKVYSDWNCIVEEEEESDIAERQRLHLEQVSSLVDEAYKKVELYNREVEYFKSTSTAVSELSSCASTLQHGTSLPESLDGQQVELDELKALPPTLETTLKINQALQRRFNNTLLKLQNSLKINTDRQVKINDELEEQLLAYRTDCSAKELKERYRVKPSSFVIPYFKDRHSIPVPMNEETKLKVQNGYIDLYSTKIRIWLKSERTLLVQAVQKEYKENAIIKWHGKLKDAERKLNDQSLTEEEVEEVNSELTTSKAYLDLLRNSTPDKLQFEKDVKIDWDKISAQTFDGVRTTEECRSQWLSYAHPSINCDEFTEEEDIMIQTMVNEDQNEKHDWGHIAESLSTARTAFQVFNRWVSFIHPALNPAGWNEEDSKKLVDTINMLRVGNHIPWTQVSRHLLGYTPSQVISRWRVLNPDLRRGAFTLEEDFNLIKGIYTYGLNFDTIAQYLPGRGKDQVKFRYRRALLPGLSHQPWEVKEDKKIIKYCHINFHNWRMLVQEVPTRNACELRLRYYTLYFWQEISDEKIMPPPLFPLSLTRKPDEIKFLRHKIYKTDESLRPFLEKIDGESGIKKEVTTFEAKRFETLKKQSKNKIAKLLKPSHDKKKDPPRLKLKRGSGPGPRKPSWPDMALLEYFLPHRILPFSGRPDPIDTCTPAYLKLAHAFQLKARKEVTADERRLVKQFGLIKEDFLLYDQLVVENKSGVQVSQAPYCDEMPLIPPSSVNVGALVSLLIHLPKLNEMASKTFLLYQISKRHLPKLGFKPMTLSKIKSFYKDTTVTVESEMIKLMKPEISAKLKEQNQMEDEPKEGGSRRAAAKKANIFNQAFLKMDEIFDGNDVLDAIDPAQMGKPTEEQMEQMMMAAKVPSVRSRIYKSEKAAQKVKERSDKLLFQRFMSLFFLPVIFTKQRPPEAAVDVATSLLDKFKQREVQDDDDLSDSELPSNISSDQKFTMPVKWGPILPGLNSLEIEEVASELQTRLCGPKRRGRVSQTIPQNIILPDDGTFNSIVERVKPNFVCDQKCINSLRHAKVLKKLWEDRRNGIKPPKVRRLEPKPVKEGMRKSERRLSLPAKLTK